MSELLCVSGLRKSFSSTRGPLLAVDGVGFEIARGETLALVGESGCGKSTIAKLLVRLDSPDAGDIRFDGTSVHGRSRAEDTVLRRKLGIVFQNPYSSLNPKMRVADIVGEPLLSNLGLGRREIKLRVIELLQAVGLGEEHVDRFPHAFSGGQRQRIAIARALALQPELLILDEPTAALDVSVQSQILNLLVDLQRQFSLSYLFISHNLATVEYIADNVMIMYLGRIVESGPVEQVFAAPRHPYTQALLDSVPRLDPSRRDQLKPLAGEVPSLLNPPKGCAFQPRCDHATAHCADSKPVLTPHADRKLACFNPLTPTPDRTETIR